MNGRLPIEPPYNAEEVATRGSRYYEAGIRERLEAEHHGEYVAINTDTGEYLVGATLLSTLKQGIALWPDARRYLLRVGYPGVARIGPFRRYFQPHYRKNEGVMTTRDSIKPPYPAEEAVERGQRFYEAGIRQRLEADNYGQYLVINTDTGEFEIDQDRHTVSRRAREKWPYAGRFLLRIGYPAIGRLGGARWRG